MESSPVLAIAKESNAQNCYECFCGKTYEKPGALRQHRLRQHTNAAHVHVKEPATLKVSRRDETFHCPFAACRSVYMSFTDFRAHVQNVHGGSVERADHEQVDIGRPNKEPRKSNFTLAEGTRNALSLPSSGKAYHTARSLDCQPIGIHLSNKETKKHLNAFGLFHENTVSQMVEHLDIDEHLSPRLDCHINLHSEDVDAVPVRNATNMAHPLNQIVDQSFLPGIMIANGNYHEPSDELLKLMTYDFRLSPNLLHAVAVLHTGAIISDKASVFILTAEAYGRGKSTDVHSESDGKSLPGSRCRYGTISAGIYNEADGKTMKKKLKIGGKHFNVLVTMGCRLQHDSMDAVNIGPETSCVANDIQPPSASIFFREQNCKRFLEAMTEVSTYSVPASISGLRQLVSSFGDLSTYHLFRASHEEFETDTRMPSTVFTLCDLPHNEGYGSSGTSTPKLASRFLQSLAISFMTDTRPNFTPTLQKYSVITLKSGNEDGSRPPAQARATLANFVDRLQAAENSVSPSILATTVNFSAIAQEAGTGVAAANKKIKMNVADHLKALYHHL